MKKTLTLAATVAGILAFGGVASAAEGGRGAQAPVPVGTPGGPIYTPPPHQNISGVWWIQRYSPKIEIVGGGELPFTP
ncbi:MAG TPA: hypothetical protein VIA80_10845, partial [Hyphomonadaceae bacterium]